MTTTIKERPIIFPSDEMVRAILAGRKTVTRRVVKQIRNDSGEWVIVPSIDNVLRCPFGDVGDRLWVREAWTENDGEMFYRATFDQDTMDTGDEPWHPSIYMHRGASRITLEVTGVRVERLQEMTMSEMDAEGTPFDAAQKLDGDTSRLEWFKALWDKLNAKRGYGWDANPWTWVINFKRLERDS